jgi:hypothetical protein
MSTAASWADGALTALGGFQEASGLPRFSRLKGEEWKNRFADEFSI